jgi:orotidine-5'-phosphate decarboxylase
LLRQGDAKVFKKYSQMKLQMKREALEKINRRANEAKGFALIIPVTEAAAMRAVRKRSSP